MSASAAGISIPGAGPSIPPGLAKAKQLEHLGTRLNATEINATYYKHACRRRPSRNGRRACPTASNSRSRRRASAPTARSWARRASRSASSARRASPSWATSSGRSCGSWRRPRGSTRDEIRAFLMLLPTSRDGIALRHALEVRHESFKCREFVALARASHVAIVFADHETYPEIADLTADFVYARLQQAKEAEPAGYSAAALDRWAEVARGWAAGESPAGLDYVSDAKAPRRRRARSSPSSSAAPRSAIPPPPKALIGAGCNEPSSTPSRRSTARCWAASRRPTPRRSPPRSAARTRPSSPGGWCRRRGAASWCGCSARCCARRRRRSAGWSAANAARSSPRASARSRR